MTLYASGWQQPPAPEDRHGDDGYEPVTTADDALTIALTARRALQLLRDSDLAGGRVWIAADRACRAVDDVVREATYIKQRRQR